MLKYKIIRYFEPRIPDKKKTLIGRELTKYCVLDFIFLDEVNGKNRPYCTVLYCTVALSIVHVVTHTRTDRQTDTMLII